MARSPRSPRPTVDLGGVMRSSADDRDWAAAVDALVRDAPASTPGQDPGAQLRLLALLGSAAPLSVLLDGLATYVETWALGLHCTVLLVDPTGRLLRPGAAPSLPEAYCRAIDPVPIGLGEGCCGTAAASREMVVVEDVEQSDLWVKYAAVALAHGLRACWSVPVFDADAELLGTLAVYYRERRTPSAHEIELLLFAASLAAFVIQRHRDVERLRTSEARLRAAVGAAEIGLWETTADGECHWFDNWCERLDVDPCVGRDAQEQWSALIHPDDRQRYEDADESCGRGADDHYDVDYRIRTRSGGWRWVHERGRVTAIASDGGARQFAGVCFDVTGKKALQAELRTAEERYELAINAAQLPVWNYDVSSDTVTGNSFWHLTVGRDPTEVEARGRVESWLSDIHPDDVAEHNRVYAGDAADETGFYQTEFRIRTTSGEYKWLLDRGRVVDRAADGTPRKVVGISLDIDARKRIERELRESVERFRGAFEFAGIGMALVAPDGRFLRVNRSLCGIVGYRADELLTTNFQAITHPDDLDADLDYMRQMLHGTLAHYDMEKRYLHKDGHAVWVLLSVSLVRDAAGDALYFVGQIQDISARKQVERQLVESELRYRTIADLVPGFVFEGVVRDGYPHPTWVSEGFERVFGCTLNRFVELGGKGFYNSSTRTRILAGAASVAGGSNLVLEVPVKSLDGGQRWLRVVARAVPLGSSAGSDRVLGVAEDITERMRLERVLTEATYREHQRLGQEIHDGLGQELTGIAYLASSLATEAKRTQSALATDLASLARLAGETIKTCKNIARGVSPLTESRGSLAQSLRRVAESAATAAMRRLSSRRSRTPR